MWSFLRRKQLKIHLDSTDASWAVHNLGGGITITSDVCKYCGRIKGYWLPAGILLERDGETFKTCTCSFS